MRTGSKQRTVALPDRFKQILIQALLLDEHVRGFNIASAFPFASKLFSGCFLLFFSFQLFFSHIIHRLIQELSSRLKGQEWTRQCRKVSVFFGIWARQPGIGKPVKKMQAVAFLIAAVCIPHSSRLHDPMQAAAFLQRVIRKIMHRGKKRFQN